MTLNNTWKVIGKSDGIEPIFYDGDPEFVSEPTPGDVVELDNGEYAIVYKLNGKIRLLTESEIKRLDVESVSYRFQ